MTVEAADALVEVVEVRSVVFSQGLYLLEEVVRLIPKPVWEFRLDVGFMQPCEYVECLG